MRGTRKGGVPKIKDEVFLEYLDYDVDGKKWFAFYTRPQQENKVERYLTDRGIKVFVPRAPKYLNVAGKRRLVEAPLFRSYVFAKLHYKTDEYYLALDAPGISTIIHKKGIPQPIPDEEMKSLITVVNRARGNILEHPFLKLGQRVIVVEGPLKGAVGVIEKIDKDKTLFFVNISLLKRSVSVPLHPRMVERYRGE